MIEGEATKDNVQYEEEEGSTISSTNGGNLHQPPTVCRLDSKRCMFRVTRARGKALQSGGFGVAMAIDMNTEDEHDGETDEHQEEDEENISSTDEEDAEQADTTTTTTTSPTEELPTENSAIDNEDKDKPKVKVKVADHLFLEEVLFLFEQGLLECFPEHEDPNNIIEAAYEENALIQQQQQQQQQQQSIRNPLHSSQLYALLGPMNLSLAAYLTYAHLRQQTFRVIRYSPQRLSILQEMEDRPSKRNSGFRNLKLKLRKDVQQSPSPTVLDERQLRSSQQQPTFAFCAYQPDSHFSRSNPGMPSFLVVVTYFGQSTLSFPTLLELLKQAKGIPVKIATVADSGTVMMFGISDFGVPVLESKLQAKK